LREEPSLRTIGGDGRERERERERERRIGASGASAVKLV
jgi:hypothetical protein